MKAYMSGKAKESEQLKQSGKLQSNIKRKFTQAYYSGAGIRYASQSNTSGHFFFQTLVHLEEKLKNVMPDWEKKGAYSSKVRRKLSQLIPSNATKYEGNHSWNQSVARVYDVIKNNN